jgi:hypothetical protein
MALPNELWLEVFENLPVRDLLSAYRVDRRWRSLVPSISESVRLTLFKLAIKDIERPSNGLHCVSLPDRISYVSEVEGSRGICIPEPYRTLLTEWPVARPPVGSHWPHAVRFHASGFCSCHRAMHESERCLCKEMEVATQNVTLTQSLLDIIRDDQPFDYHDPHKDCRWELFSNPPRLHTDVQNDQTIRFILMHPPAMWSRRGEHEHSWPVLKLQALRLSRYTVVDDSSGVTGEFYMVLEGPARGEIHGWESGGWYNGFEATSFLDWRYDEWPGEDDTSGSTDGEDSDETGGVTASSVVGETR